MIILGIDPGSNAMGVGAVELDGSHLRHVASEVIRTPSGPTSDRLAWIHDRLTEKLKAWGPDSVALESIFTARNARSALLLGQARGVALAVCGLAGLPTAEYAPAQIKQGRGPGSARRPSPRSRGWCSACSPCRGRPRATLRMRSPSRSATARSGVRPARRASRKRRRRHAGCAGAHRGRGDDRAAGGSPSGEAAGVRRPRRGGRRLRAPRPAGDVSRDAGRGQDRSRAGAHPCARGCLAALRVRQRE